MGHPSLYFLKVLCNPSWHNSSRNIIYLSSHTIPQSSLTYSPLRKNFFTTTHIRNIAFTSLHCPPKPQVWRNCWPYCSLTRPLWVEFPVKWADTPQMWLVLSDSGGTHWQKEQHFSGPRTLYPSEQGWRHLSTWARDHEETIGSPAGASVGPDLLWVEVTPERGLGSVHSCQWAGGGRADLGLLDGPSSSGAS